MAPQSSIRPPGPSLTLTLEDLAPGAKAFARLRGRVLDRQQSNLDLSRVGRIGTAQIAVLTELASEAQARGIKLGFVGLSDGVSKALQGAAAALVLDEDEAEPEEAFLERVGEEALRVAADIVGWRRFVNGALSAIFVDPFLGRRWKWSAVLEEMDLIGVQGTAIVVFISLLVGTVLALNGAHQLRQFGALIFIANLVGVAMTREMGPLMTAVIVAGRSGSAIAAELGTMVVSEEIDAMRTMALEPSRFLLAPRVIALAITMPCLTVLSDVAGIFGGYMVVTGGMGVSSPDYIRQTSQALLISDLITGLVKSAVYAVLIGLISCYEGLSVSGGAQGVGAATTRAVVSSIVAAIVADAIFTLVFYATGG